MLLTAPLLSKTSFFGSLVQKCRQVIKNQQPKASNILPPPNDRQTNNNKNIKDVSQSSNSITANSNNVNAPTLSISSIDRPAAIANLIATTTTRDASSTPRITLEEKIGLPPRPKKPLTPFFRYLQEHRPKLMQANPKLSTMEAVRQISHIWKDTDPVLKKRLQDDYKRDQQKYIETRARYDATLTDEQRAELKQLKVDIQESRDRRMMRKRVKQLGRPKKPASAFLRFIVQERINSPQLPKQTYREWHRKCTENWNRLSDKEKESFLVESRREMEVYKKEIVEWEEKMVRLGNIDVVRHFHLIDPPEPKSKGAKPTSTST